MKFSEFPQEIIDKVRERTIEQGNEFDITVYDEMIHRGRRGGGMNWSSTPEHHNFWEQVLKKQNFDVFFKKYPKHEGFELPFREGDIVKSISNTFNQDRNAVGKYFRLSKKSSDDLNRGYSAILDSYPSGKNNEFSINWKAENLIITARAEILSIVKDFKFVKIKEQVDLPVHNSELFTKFEQSFVKGVEVSSKLKMLI